MGEVIARLRRRHDRGTILAVVGDEHTDARMGRAKTRQGLLPGSNGLEESQR